MAIALGILGRGVVSDGRPLTPGVLIPLYVLVTREVPAFGVV
jgi:hypothetical protein